METLCRASAFPRDSPAELCGREAVPPRPAVRDKLCWRTPQPPEHSLAHVQPPPTGLAPCRHLRVSVAWRHGTAVLLGRREHGAGGRRGAQRGVFPFSRQCPAL